MIRIALVDDHPALIAGLTAVLRAEPGIVPVGAAGDATEAEHLIYSTSPDLVLLDYHLPQGDGLQVCGQVKAWSPGTKVLIYSAYADATLGLAARVAGADGLANKAAPARELFEIIRRVNGGEQVLPDVSAEVLNEASSRLQEEDLPLLGMLIDGTSRTEAAEVLRIPPNEITRRVSRVLGRLRVEVPIGTIG